MNESTQSIKELREEYVACEDFDTVEVLIYHTIDRLEVAESRNEAGAKQIDELQDLVIALRDQVIELGGRPTTEYTHIEAAHALLTAAEDRVKELEAAQQPRPMVDAPRGVKILVRSNRGWEVMESEADGWGCAACGGEYGIGCSEALGWLPLPDQSGGKP